MFLNNLPVSTHLILFTLGTPALTPTSISSPFLSKSSMAKSTLLLCLFNTIVAASVEKPMSVMDLTFAELSTSIASDMLELLVCMVSGSS